VPKRLAGKRLRCKNCSQAIQVPELEPEPEEPPFGEPIPLADEPLLAAAETPPSIGLAPVRLPPARRAGSEDDPQSLRSFRKRFRDHAMALAAYAKATATRFAYRNVTSNCCNCQREGEFGIFEFHWKGVLRSGAGFHWTSLITIWFGMVVFSRASDQIKYITYHRLCNRCRTSSITLGIFGGIAWIIAAVLLVIGFCVAAIGLALQANSHGVHPMLVTGIIMFVCSLAGMGFLRRLKIPGRLRSVAPRPFCQENVRQVG